MRVLLAGGYPVIGYYLKHSDELEGQVKWLADERLDNDIIRGLFSPFPVWIWTRTGHLRSRWSDAARNDRMVLTHDRATMVPA